MTIEMIALIHMLCSASDMNGHEERVCKAYYLTCTQKKSIETCASIRAASFISEEEKQTEIDRQSLIKELRKVADKKETK